ncbi:MAG: hypothetical protein ABIG96_05280 [Candidatus Micrarchaeota archaeon]
MRDKILWDLGPNNSAIIKLEVFFLLFILGFFLYFFQPVFRTALAPYVIFIICLIYLYIFRSLWMQANLEVRSNGIKFGGVPRNPFKFFNPFKPKFLSWKDIDKIEVGKQSYWMHWRWAIIFYTKDGIQYEQDFPGYFGNTSDRSDFIEAVKAAKHGNLLVFVNKSGLIY